MITVAVCDDDVIYLNEMAEMIRRAEKVLDSNIKIRKFSDVDDLMAEMSGKKGIDILLLDIELGRTNGIQIAEELKNRFPGLVLIYISAHGNYVFEAVRTEPMDFLIKPVTDEVLQKCLKKAVKKICDLDFIRVKDNTGYYHIRIDDISYISSDRKYLHIVTEDNMRYTMVSKLDDFAEKLEKYEFFIRIHKSYLVNFNYVKRYENKKVIMYNGEEINISRERRGEVREKYLALKID